MSTLDRRLSKFNAGESASRAPERFVARRELADILREVKRPSGVVSRSSDDDVLWIYTCVTEVA